MDKGLLDTVSDAIEIAGKIKPYGLYDYSNYPGDEPPHVVKDERPSGPVTEIARFGDGDTARMLYDKLSRDYIAECALRAVSAWMTADLAHRWAQFHSRKF